MVLGKQLQMYHKRYYKKIFISVLFEIEGNEENKFKCPVTVAEMIIWLSYNGIICSHKKMIVSSNIG